MLKKNGFTMLELLIVLVIMSMITVMSIPAFSSHIRGSRLRTAAREISSAVMSARTQAITLRENRTVFFQKNEGDFGIITDVVAGTVDEEGWFFPPGVTFNVVDDFPVNGITLTPMGMVYGIPADGYFDITISNGEHQKTITIGELGHVVIN